MSLYFAILNSAYVINSCRRGKESFEHVVLGQCSQAFGTIFETAQLFGIRNSESVIFGSGSAGLG